MLAWFTGQTYLTLDLNYASAQDQLNESLALSYPWPRYDLATIELREGRRSNAIRLLMAATLQVENTYEAPLFYSYTTTTHMIIGDFQKAMETTQAGLNLIFDGPIQSSLLRQHAKILRHLGRSDEAITFIKEAWSVDGILRPQSYVALYAQLNNMDRVHELLADLELNYINAADLAESYLYLGDRGNTIKPRRAVD